MDSREKSIAARIPVSRQDHWVLVFWFNTDIAGFHKGCHTNYWNYHEHVLLIIVPENITSRQTVGIIAIHLCILDLFMGLTVATRLHLSKYRWQAVSKFYSNFHIYLCKEWTCLVDMKDWIYITRHSYKDCYKAQTYLQTSNGITRGTYIFKYIISDLCNMVSSEIERYTTWKIATN